MPPLLCKSVAASVSVLLPSMKLQIQTNGNSLVDFGFSSEQRLRGLVCNEFAILTLFYSRRL